MSGDALASAFQDLIASKVDQDYILRGTTGTRVYLDKVPGTPSYPYVYVLTNFPTVAERSAARSVQSRALRSRCIVAGLTGASVRIIAQKLTNCLEGKRPVVAGWTLGAIESVPNEQQLLPDNDVTINGQHPLYQPFDWVLTGSETD